MTQLYDESNTSRSSDEGYQMSSKNVQRSEHLTRSMLLNRYQLSITCSSGTKFSASSTARSEKSSFAASMPEISVSRSSRCATSFSRETVGDSPRRVASDVWTASDSDAEREVISGRAIPG